MDLQHKKAALRKQARQYLRMQPPQTFSEWGNAMALALFELDVWKNAQTVFCFVSTDLEPSTLPILKAVLAHKGTLCVPRTTDENGQMDAVSITDLNQLSAGRWGLLEPSAQLAAFEPQQLDLIVAPCLMAGPNGARLGQGGGYYDRFFSRCQCPSVVLCPSDLVHPNLPLEPFDCPIDYVITETGVLLPNAR